MQPVQQIGLFGKRLRIKRLPCRAGKGIAGKAAQIERRRLLHRDGQARCLLRCSGKIRKRSFRQHSLPGFVPEPVQRHVGSGAPFGEQCTAAQSRHSQKRSRKHACRCQQCAIIQKHRNGFFVICRAACQQKRRTQRAHRHPGLRRSRFYQRQKCRRQRRQQQAADGRRPADSIGTERAEQRCRNSHKKCRVRSHSGQRQEDMSRGLRQRLARGAADRNGSREEAPGKDRCADQAEQRKHSAEPAARESKRHALPDQRRSACGGPEPAVVCPDPGGSLCRSQKSGEKERSTDCTHRQCGHFFLRIAADEGKRGSILFFHARSPLNFEFRKLLGIVLCVERDRLRRVCPAA